jgi:hypothetical protein
MNFDPLIGVKAVVLMIAAFALPFICVTLALILRVLKEIAA